jgi:hypothetical protein
MAGTSGGAKAPPKPPAPKVGKIKF